MARVFYDVWVKASKVEDQKSDLKDVIILKDKDGRHLFYTAVDADQVTYKEDDE